MKPYIHTLHPPYFQKAKNITGRALAAYWPLWDTSGEQCSDIGPNGLHGSISNITLGDDGIGDGNASYKLTSGSMWVNLFSAGLSSKMNFDEGTFSCWFKPETWSTPEWRYLAGFQIDPSNYIVLLQAPDVFKLMLSYVGGGLATYNYLYGLTNPIWTHIAFSWSRSNDRLRMYLNGVQQPDEQTGLPSITGVLTSAAVATSPTSGANMIGHAAHALLCDSELNPDQVMQLANFGPLRTYSALGDSITSATDGWLDMVVGSYPHDVRSCVHDHSAAGQSIMGHMEAQVSAARRDQADVIIIALGANDNNSGDMSALQGEVEENLIELKRSHPPAVIRYMNVLPQWTDNTGVVEVPMNNVRAAIAAACEAQSVECWDTYTTAWITADQTSDGVHPTASGNADIATQVLMRL